MINVIDITPLKKISTYGGDVLHGLKKSDSSFKDFGEAYFSIIESGAIKAWKRHLRMTLNLIVPVGNVRFVFIGESNDTHEFNIGENNYARVTVPPNIWFGFQGLSKGSSLVLNISDIEHDPNEVQRKKVSDINYDWNEK